MKEFYKDLSKIVSIALYSLEKAHWNIKSKVDV